MSLKPCAVSIGIALLPFAVAASGQQPPPPVAKPAQIEAKPAQNIGMKIDLDVVVTTRSGDPVAGLQQQDFTVLDNKVTRPVASFLAVTKAEAPVEVILLLDAVNTGFDTVAYERGEVDKFLAGEGEQLAHPLTLAVLTDLGMQIQPRGSRDCKQVRADLDQYTVALRTIRRSAGFYGGEDRLNISLQALDGLIARLQATPGRKIVLWVSPGWPLISGPQVDLTSKQQQQIFKEIQSLSTRMRLARLTITSIDPLGSSENLQRSQYYKVFLDGISKPGQVDAGDLALQVLATQSGGLALTGNNDISGLLRQAMNDSKTFYEISYEPPPGEPAGQYHKVEVKVDKPGLTLRTRTGYYTQP